MPTKILFLVPYPHGESPSQRFRFEQYFALLEQHGFKYRIQSFLNSHNWQLFFKPGRPIQKLIALLAGFGKRWIILFQSPAYDFVFVHREATPLGPPIMEWLLTKVFRRKIIYDFDDAIWLTDRKHEPPLFKLVKWRSKVSSICRWAHAVSCGNDYLCSYASMFNKNVHYIPTTIDTQHWHNPEAFKPKTGSAETVTIGWTGSHSTLKYLVELEDVLKKLEQENPSVRFVVIADRKPGLRLKAFSFISWNKVTEAEDLLRMDIGIMPLPDDEWAKGKCGFKALQYMAMGIPAVVSPVGVNRKIIEEGVDGFFADTPESWNAALKKLISDEALRRQMGAAGRKKVIDAYSVTSVSSSFIALFEKSSIRINPTR
jgi:glycosyltransferase involved in cell wall biosynthesis